LVFDSTRWLLVQRVQHGVAGAVGGGAGALHGLFAVVGGVAAERTLVDRAVGVAVERHAEMFELDTPRSGASRHMNSIGILVGPSQSDRP
jgi:hypothetical protein